MACVERCLGRLRALLERVLLLPTGSGLEGVPVELRDLEAAAPRSCHLDPQQHGAAAEVSRFCVSGCGAALATTLVEQEAAYWEIEVVTAGSFCVGLAAPARTPQDRARLELALGDGVRSWALRSSAVDPPLAPGDVVGVYLDQREFPILKFNVNGDWSRVDEHKFCKGVKGDVRPAVSVDRGAILKFRFSAFKFPPSGAYAKFGPIIAARSVI
jgi:hypothetical protein